MKPAIRHRSPPLPDHAAQERVDNATQEAFQLALDALFNRDIERALHVRARREREGEDKAHGSVS